MRPGTRTPGYGHRDATMILLAYRHGLRVGELVALRWDQIDLKLGRIHVRRLKGSEEAEGDAAGRRFRAAAPGVCAPSIYLQPKPLSFTGYGNCLQQ
jgi:hypothetical protein